MGATQWAHGRMLRLLVYVQNISFLAELGCRICSYRHVDDVRRIEGNIAQFAVSSSFAVVDVCAPKIDGFEQAITICK